MLRIGGGLLAGLAAPRLLHAGGAVDILLRGNADGSQVWFDPVGVRIESGGTVRWTNRDSGNSHTATAYHPRNDRPLRIPPGAEPWNSDYLLPDESFSITLAVEGVYDFFCIPHEHAGMVGRIVVGDPSHSPAGAVTAAGVEAIPEAALQGLPTVDDIMRQGVVRRAPS